MKLEFRCCAESLEAYFAALHTSNPKHSTIWVSILPLQTRTFSFKLRVLLTFLMLVLRGLVCEPLPTALKATLIGPLRDGSMRVHVGFEVTFCRETPATVRLNAGENFSTIYLAPIYFLCLLIGLIPSSPTPVSLLMKLPFFLFDKSHLAALIAALYRPFSHGQVIHLMDFEMTLGCKSSLAARVITLKRCLFIRCVLYLVVTKMAFDHKRFVTAWKLALKLSLSSFMMHGLMSSQITFVSKRHIASFFVAFPMLERLSVMLKLLTISEHKPTLRVLAYESLFFGTCRLSVLWWLWRLIKRIILYLNDPLLLFFDTLWLLFIALSSSFFCWSFYRFLFFRLHIWHDFSLFGYFSPLDLFKQD